MIMLDTSRAALGPPGAALAVDDLAVEVRASTGWRNVVDGVSLSVAPGETLGIVGESGSGKTVTSLALMGLLPPSARVSSGTIKLGDIELVGADRRTTREVRGNRMAMIFQEPMTSLNPALRIGDQLAEGLRNHQKVSRAEARSRVIEVLDLVGIPNARRRLDSYPHEFSGGMRQRAMIAMSLVCRPEILIADEPTTALDVTIQSQILELLTQIQSEMGLAVILITHNMGVVAEVCDRVAVMYNGEIVEQAPVETLFASPRHPYTEGLLRSMPSIDGIRGHLPTIPGRPPQLLERERCAFVARCPYMRDDCHSTHPSLRVLEPDTQSRCRHHDLPFQGI